MELRITGTKTEENISGKSKVYKISTEKGTAEPKQAEKQKTNVHKNHRLRLKSQFVENGIDVLTDIQ